MADINIAFQKNPLWSMVRREKQNKKQNEYQLYNYYEHINKPVFEVPIDSYYRPTEKKVPIENKLLYQQFQNRNKWLIEEQTTDGRKQPLIHNINTLPKDMPFLVTTSINQNTIAVEKYDKYGLNTRNYGRKSNSYYKQSKDKHASEENYFV